MPVNFQVVDYDPLGTATPFPAAVIVPGDEIGDHTLRGDQWGIALGDPRQLCLVIAGRRDDVLGVLRAAVEELERYYSAEHENGYHLRAPEEQCPDCAPAEMACPACGEADDRNGWAERAPGEWRKRLPPDSVACGNCRHVWQPFARAVAATEGDDYDHSAAKEDARNEALAAALADGEDVGGCPAGDPRCERGECESHADCEHEAALEDAAHAINDSPAAAKAMAIAG